MQRRCLLLFAATFLALTALSAAARRSSWMVNVTIPVATSSPRPSPEYFLATDHTATLDQLVFQHQIRDVSGRAREANVLFLGNSRSLFALPERHCAPVLRRAGLSWYHLGFPCESWLFAVHMIEQMDLHPELVVVDADGFFENRMSAIAKRSLGTNRFNAHTTYYEACVSHAVRHQLHRLIPHIPSMFLAEESMVVYRSAANGAWFVAAGRGTPSGVNELVDPHLSTASTRAALLVSAREFLTTIQQRGGRVILTYIPSRLDRTSDAKWLAEELGCPFVSPSISGLTTLDGSHLDQRSVDQFAPEFLDQLIHVPEFQRLAAMSSEHLRHVQRSPASGRQIQ